MEDIGQPRAFLSGTASDQPISLDKAKRFNVLMLLAEGFEDAEAACVIDVLGWTHYRPEAALADVTIGALHEEVRGAFGTRFKADVQVGHADCSRYDALVIPGGFHSRGYDEIYCPDIYRLVRSAKQLGKPIATLCVGSLVVAEAGELEGGEATTYPFSSRHDNPGRLEELGCTAVEEPIVEWDGVISCSGPAYSEQVALRLLEKLIGTDAVADIDRKRRGY